MGEKGVFTVFGRVTCSSPAMVSGGVADVGPDLRPWNPIPWEGLLGSII